ncbi:unnamed protein product [Rotaria socialis]|uniref:LysM domain-containing protein n=1 Tax=Rotaria socialis TaxID=392032 RepID=A0A818MHE5_9BILA|nr:unnamed protein product [Rotaria socialis]CAF3436309.1 unnamed protein product [Rotaria socialis]CAF3585295.1 unnamed protein product [Rotaria socialis]CAF3617798.1 unnamed protein product [Rotaria socialis]CAF4216224.1 unnamed protein product [Rotaria socialis]
MNILKESLFSSSKSTSQTKSKRTRQNNSRTNKFLEENNNSLNEPLLSSSEIGDNSIQLGIIHTDDEEDDGKKLNSRHIVRSRNIKQPSISAAHGGGSVVIVEKPIRPNETIQAFAIRYRVPVSQLKRINNLQNDQDFYALTYCRVPVRRFGLLHESSSPSIVVNLNDPSTTNTSSSSITHLSQQNHLAFLKAMDHDLAAMRTKVEQLIETPTATLISDQPTTKMMIRSTAKPISELNCDGADCGCKLWHIVTVIILIALLIPLYYVYVYIKHPPLKTDHFP